MGTSVRGTDILFNDSSTQGTAAFTGNRNRIINGNPLINQRAYVSGAVTTVGQYTLDRWKVSSTAGVTFSTTSNKVTVTIPAGQTLQQIVEGLNLGTGTYVLSWEGTAQGRIGAGAYGNSGAVTASVTGGTNTTVEFNAGTLANVQLELGSIATQFEHRDYGRELMMCQRYYQTGYNIYHGGPTTVGIGTRVSVPFKQQMRATPAVTLSNINKSGVYTAVWVFSINRDGAVIEGSTNATSFGVFDAILTVTLEL